jgi:hypothetical protein
MNNFKIKGYSYNYNESLTIDRLVISDILKKDLQKLKGNLFYDINKFPIHKNMKAFLKIYQLHSVDLKLFANITSVRFINDISPFYAIAYYLFTQNDCSIRISRNEKLSQNDFFIITKV